MMFTCVNEGGRRGFAVLGVSNQLDGYTESLLAKDSLVVGVSQQPNLKRRSIVQPRFPGEVNDFSNGT